MSDSPLYGIEKFAEHIPEDSWRQVVNTACHTFESVVAPITATTSGLGRLITARFDRLTEAERINLADMVSLAKRRGRRPTSRPGSVPAASLGSGRTFVESMEAAAGETDPEMRELWINLLAQQLSGTQVHPEMARILGRLTPVDAQVLRAIASAKPKPSRLWPPAMGGFDRTNIPEALSSLSPSVLEMATEQLRHEQLLAGYGNSPSVFVVLLSRLLGGPELRRASSDHPTPYIDGRLPREVRAVLRLRLSRKGEMLLSAVSDPREPTA